MYHNRMAYMARYNLGASDGWIALAARVSYSNIHPLPSIPFVFFVFFVANNPAKNSLSET
jgi:hypothetical protein